MPLFVVWMERPIKVNITPNAIRCRIHALDLAPAKRAQLPSFGQRQLGICRRGQGEKTVLVTIREHFQSVARMERLIAMLATRSAIKLKFYARVHVHARKNALVQLGIICRYVDRMAKRMLTSAWPSATTSKENAVENVLAKRKRKHVEVLQLKERRDANVQRMLSQSVETMGKPTLMSARPSATMLSLNAMENVPVQRIWRPAQFQLCIDQFAASMGKHISMNIYLNVAQFQLIAIGSVLVKGRPKKVPIRRVTASNRMHPFAGKMVELTSTGVGQNVTIRSRFAMENALANNYLTVLRKRNSD